MVVMEKKRNWKLLGYDLGFRVMGDLVSRLIMRIIGAIICFIEVINLLTKSP